MSTLSQNNKIWAMISFLETPEVREEAAKMAEEMIANNSISFPPSADYPLSIADEKTMFAILIALPPSSDERKILRGFSGSLKRHYQIPGYVNPCFSISHWEEEEKKNDERIHELTSLIEKGNDSLKAERKKLTEESLERLSKLYRFRCYNGEDIQLPSNSPWGTGDCAGLRCINTALRKKWEIIGLAEFQIINGKPEFHAPCTSRCHLLLPSMLGLDYLYADSSIAVIEKEAGLLSVPGRGDDKKDSAAYRFHSLFPRSPVECTCHRLDMDTSGLLVLAFTRDAKRKLSMAFENHEVKKEYEALLEGVLTEDEGMIDIPIRLDVDNRPYQIADYQNGKKAVTLWKRLGVEVIDGKKYTRVRFFPKTGRTHQLRVHSSLIGHPIKGDRLYGTRTEGERLMLHAAYIEFNHPETGERISFSSPSPF